MYDELVPSPGPRFPEGIGALLRAVLDDPGPSAGPPYTHVFRYPRTEYDDEGEPIWQPPQPTLSVRIVEAEVQDAVTDNPLCLAMKLPPHPLTLTNLNRERSR